MKWLGKFQPCWLQTQSDQQPVVSAVAQAKVAEEGDDDGYAEAFAQVEGFDLDRAVTRLSSNEISTVKLAWDLRSFILWADVLREQNDLRSYLCVMLPVLISWAAYPNEPNSSSELIPIAKDRKTYQVEIRQLSKAADRFYSNRSWLDNTNNSVSRVVACLCCYVHVEATIGLDTLFDHLQLVQDTLLSVLGPGNSESVAIAAQCAEKINKIQTVNYQRGAGIRRPLHGDLEEDLRPRKRQKPVTMDCFDLGSDESQAVQLLGEARREAGAVIAVTATSTEPSSGGRKPVLTDLEVTFVTAAQAISPGVGAIAAAFICDPKNISLANSLYRLARIAPELNRFGLNVIERTLPVNRLASQHPNSIPANLLAGHELLSRRKLAEGIDKYIEAYQLDPTQPLTNLCLAVLFLHLSLHPLVLERREVLVKALVFLEEYRKYRRQRDPNLGLRNSSSSGKPITGSSDMITEAALAQETFYNVGRAFHQLSLNSLAEKNYRQALQLEEEHPELKQSTLKVTAAAAMNLVLIYKKSQSPNLALEVIEKYLTF